MSVTICISYNATAGEVHQMAVLRTPPSSVAGMWLALAVILCGLVIGLVMRRREPDEPSPLV